MLVSSGSSWTIHQLCGYTQLTWSHPQCAIHPNGVTINVVMADKIKHQLRVFIWTPQASRERYRSFQCFAELWSNARHHRCFNDSGCNGIDTDAEGGQVPGSCNGEGVHA